jgi:hypothetical protein
MRRLQHNATFEKNRQLKMYISKNNPSNAEISSLLRGDSIPSTGFFVNALTVDSPAFWAAATLDTQTIAAKKGNPTFFLTITGNEHWPEIVTFNKDPELHYGTFAVPQNNNNPACPGSSRHADTFQNRFSRFNFPQFPYPKDSHRPTEHPDIMTRVFKGYLDKIIKFIKTSKIFGSVSGEVTRIEFQKRGMPHAHLLIWTDADLTDPTSVHQFLSAEYPTLELAQSDFNFFFQRDYDETNNEHVTFIEWYLPLIQNRVKSLMTHKHSNRCGGTDAKCQWKYPFLTGNNQAFFTHMNYLVHMRRDPPKDQWIVPHNRILIALFNCHINGEPCACSSCIGYILEYLGKKEKDVGVKITTPPGKKQPRNHIKEFLTSGYHGTCEIAWRIRGWQLYRAIPAVTQIRMHDSADRIRITSGDTSKTSLFSLSDQELYFCRPKQNLLVRNLSIIEFFQQYRTVKYDQNNQKLIHTDEAAIKFLRQNLFRAAPSMIEKLKKSFTQMRHQRICRLGVVLPRQKEKFMMRKPFLHKSAFSYIDLKTDATRNVHDTFEKCAEALGLLATANEWEHHMKDAILLKSSPRKLRRLFVLLVSWGADALDLYTQFHEIMSIDFPKVGRERKLREVLHEMFLPFALDPIKCRLPPLFPGSVRMSELEILKRVFSVENAKATLAKANFEKKANASQQRLHSKIVNAVLNAENRLFFLQGRGGVGKTFLIKYVTASLRSLGKVVWCCATTGIAAINFQRGSTMHHLFKLQLNTSDSDSYKNNVLSRSDRAHTLRNLDLIVIDEISMCSGINFTLISKILQDVRNNTKPMGGITMLGSGDLLQLPSVVKSAVNLDQVLERQIHRSITWNLHVEPILLSEPTRQKNDLEYYDLLLRIAEGDVPNADYANELPLIHATSDTEDAQQFVYPDIENIHLECPLDSAILTSTNISVDKHNSRLQQRNPREIHTLYSADSWILPDKTEIELTDANFEFSSNCNKVGVPPHQLRLKIGDPIMILRNLDTANELVNGTRGILINISPNRRLLVVKVVKQDKSSEQVLIPRIDFIIKVKGPKNQLRRRQFPVRLSYAMTVHKAQGHTLRRVCLDLRAGLIPTCPGQLYVALSRVCTRQDLIILTHQQNLSSVGTAVNVHHYFSDERVKYVRAIDTLLTQHQSQKIFAHDIVSFMTQVESNSEMSNENQDEIDQKQDQMDLSGDNSLDKSETLLISNITYQIIPVPNDGNCPYVALSLALQDNNISLDHFDLSALLTSFALALFELKTEWFLKMFNAFFQTDQVQILFPQYQVQITNGARWAGSFEFLLFSIYFNCDIRVHLRSRPSQFFSTLNKLKTFPTLPDILPRFTVFLGFVSDHDISSMTENLYNHFVFLKQM